ncbi:PQQ-binding-like beta-propeller repeat protein [Natrinema halophilum]|uniref:PQQ-binding-like beta-propeller repeat protein n=1 Tax=Natrinema halophilum TaxID=1699371 RepID=A0A7D5GI91_9EURY|nr:PQQ-binding-like beta-propeller repeat protein [Natrinema halophilum]QLG47450.1 PQQ-binding-like beta-propeller repeat protein [Natrinema halophilum]
MTDYGRRRFLMNAGLTVACGGMAATAGAGAVSNATVGGSSASGAAQWSSEHGNAANTGYAPSTVGPKPPVTVTWEYDHGGSIAVVDDTVYLTADDGRVHALDAADGSVEWTSEISSEKSVTAAGSPAVASDTVYVSGDRNSPAVTALDAANGDVRWKKTDLGYATNLSPVVAGGSVFIIVDKILYALDADTGKKLWRFEPNLVSFDGREYGDMLVRRPVAVADGAVFAVSNKRLFARDIETGDDRWTDMLQENWATEGFSGRPIADDDAVVAIRGGTPTVFDTETGEKRLTLPGHSLDVLTQDRVYATGEAKSGDGSSSAVITGYDRKTSDDVWHSSPEMQSVGTPIVDDGSVYAPVEKPSGETGVFAFDTDTGSRKWSVTTDARPSRIAVADETLYASTETTLSAIRSEDAGKTADESNEDQGKGQSIPGFTSGVAIASGVLALEGLRRRSASGEEAD